MRHVAHWLVLASIAAASISARSRTPWGDPDIRGDGMRGILSAARAEEAAKAK